ncbi:MULTISPECIES: NAD(P)/FAD-dependent oxidoreductase [Dictyoglomus]|uniref:FAD-dependent pyridine nucleotide-disulphide oxidoreductase n=1 Tax=Dictyoglomus turgidum (strain DSM 6724 / Z-1310) TaxID=515635 RepID=B8DYU4_DICTD|nr:MULTISPECIES: FAD-dependent oxidoreductase [Dictyoglomus]ACK41476.1 FAD-dependent pyridine nucleotide-disulphide oxidoreductase [Dictyoglomus turgidum DSM 6724]HBU31865.1 NAD(P)/FAD-dependent oxidoreductase [Dictyoglomus sp.]
MYLIVGNGISGINTAEVIRERDKEGRIVVISRERYPYYSRPQLIEFLAGNITIDQLPFYPEEWYKEQNIEIHYDENAIKVDTQRKILITDKNEYSFDKLILATGAIPFKPNIENINAEGVFTLRNIDDALSILSYIKEKERVILLGCGLLGLETGRALSQRGLKIIGLEFFPRLLPRQLDEEGAKILQNIIEKKFSFEFYLGVKAQKIIGSKRFEGIELEDGRKIMGDMLIVSAGIIPHIEVAKNSGIETNKGIIVNNFMETNIENIYAVGDCAEHNGRIYGIIPACMEQSEVVGRNVTSEKVEYKGTLPFNSLKVTGVDLTSIGEIEPKDNCEVFVKKDEERGFYRKLIFRDNMILGAILLGNKRSYVNKILSLMKKKEEVLNKEELLNED